MSTTFPCKSPNWIQSPGLNGASVNSRAPEARPLRVSWSAKEITSEVTPRAVSAAERSTPHTPSISSQPATIKTATLGSASRSCGIPRRSSDSPQVFSQFTITRTAASAAAAVEMSSPVPSKIVMRFSSPNPNRPRISAHAAKNGMVQARRIETTGVRVESRCLRRSSNSAVPMMTTGSTTTRISAQTAAGSENRSLIANPPHNLHSENLEDALVLPWDLLFDDRNVGRH